MDSLHGTQTNTGFLLGFNPYRDWMPASWKKMLTHLFWSTSGKRWILWDIYVGGLAAWSAFNMTPYGRQPYGLAVGVVFGLIMGLSSWLCGVPRPESNVSRYELLTISLLSVLLGIFLCMFAGLVVAYVRIGRYIWVIFGVLCFMGIILPRLMVSMLETAARYRVLIYGARGAGRTILKDLRKHKGLDIVGFVDDDRALWTCSIEGLPCLGGIDQIENICRRFSVQLLTVAINRGVNEERGAKLLKLRHLGVEIKGIPELYEMFLSRLPIDYISAQWLLEGQRLARTTLSMMLKRLVDLTGSMIGLILTLWIWPFIALAIKLDSPGPVFFRQWRMGYNRRPFTILKFRSMVMAAERNGAKWAELRDIRITRFGRFLRVTRLDELPQLLNVLGGSMSLVGPRPERPEFIVEIEKKVPFYDQRYLVAPGLTGWAQVRYQYGAGIEDAKRKLEYDLYYIRNISFMLDLQILLRTVALLMKGSR